MVAPNARLRVPPSGPLADASNGGQLAPPLGDVGGYTYQVTDYDAAAPPLFDQGNREGSSAKIGPAGGPDAFQSYLIREGSPTWNLQEPAAYRDKLVGVNPTVDDAATFGAGQWLVEAEIVAGFTTSAPLAGSLGGKVKAIARLLYDDGTEADSSEVDNLALAQPITTAAAESLFDVVHSMTVRLPLTITDDMVKDNGGALSGFMLELERASDSAPSNLGLYTSTSGYLEVFRATNLTIRRVA